MCYKSGEISSNVTLAEKHVCIKGENVEEKITLLRKSGRGQVL